MQYSYLSNTSVMIELNAEEIDQVDGGLYRVAGSVLGGLVYELVKRVAENGGPPHPISAFTDRNTDRGCGAGLHVGVCATPLFPGPLPRGRMAGKRGPLTAAQADRPFPLSRGR